MTQAIIGNQVAIAPDRIYLKQALAYREKRQWPETIQACREALKANPNLVEAYKILGDAYQSMGQFANAIGFYGKAIAIKPDFPEAYANLGSLYAQQEKWQQALDYYQKALEIKPDLAGVYEHIARVKKNLHPQTTQIDAAEIYLEQALAYREEANWEKAIHSCETALKLNPKLSEAYKVLGDAHQSLNKFSMAIGFYGKAIAIKPNFPEAYANLGTIYAQQKQWQQALDYYQKALELKPDLLGVYQHVARVLQNLGQPEKAQQVLAQAAKFKSQKQSQPQLSFQEFFDLGEQARQQNNLQQALKYYQQAVQIAPNFEQAYQRLAAITEQMGLWQESTVYYRQLLQLKNSVTATALTAGRKQLSLLSQQQQRNHSDNNNPSQQLTAALATANSAENHVSQGNSHAGKQQWREAILNYQKAINLNPKLVVAYRNLARVLNQLGKIEEATSYWVKAVELNAQSLQADEYIQLANNLVNQNKIPQAITCYSRAIKLQPNLIDAYLNLGTVLTKTGEIQKALACYQEGIKYNSQSHQLYFNLGLCLTQQEHWEQAINCYQQALKIKPNYWEALHNLGGTLGKQKLWSEAIAIYCRAIEINPDSPWSYNDLGLMLLQSDRADEAISALRKAISLKSDYAWSHYWLGDAFSVVRKNTEAIASYREAEKIQADLPQLQQKLGNVFFRQSEQGRQVALKHFRLAIEQDPHNISNYHQALAIDKNNLELYLQLGDSLLQRNNLDEAIVAYQMAVQLQPKNVEATLRLTNALMKKNPETDVKKFMERLVNLPISTLQNKENHDPIAANITLPFSEHPVVSIIVPVYNKLDYTLQCLISLASNLAEDSQVEVIVINDCSKDTTQKVLEQISGLNLVNNEQNLGFIHSCNKGAAIAKGTYLYFLNNDTEIRPRAIESLVEVLEQDQTVGAVGSKLIYPNGSLQEAGGVIWQDASGWNYGRNNNPFDPKYNYLREVDYCSGASLMVRKVIFESLGGFTADFAPAYYEDTDLCFAVRHKLGLKVVYQPKSEVVHYEGISSGTSTTSGVKKYQVVNAEKFHKKWRHVLGNGQYLVNKGIENLPTAARKYQGKQTILVIDSYMPCYDKESGSQRLFYLLKIFKDLGYHVIFVADNGVKEEPYNTELQNLQIETIYTQDGFGQTPESQIRDRLPIVNLAWICRPNLNEKYIPLIRSRENIKIIYDTIDLHYLRMQRAYELSVTKDPRRVIEWQKMQQRELQIAKQADLTITVTDVEKSILQEQGINSIAVVPNIHVPQINQNPELDTSFAARKDILFIGSYNHPPNVDAVLWLCREIMPLVWRKLPEVKVTLLGSNPTDQVKRLSSDLIKVTGYIPDVSEYFFNHRIFVSPLRYGAGMKGKIGQSIEYSLPVISTKVGIEGMYLTAGKDVLVANDTQAFAKSILNLYQTEELWNHLGSNSQKAIQNFAPKVIKQKLKQIMESPLITV